MEAEARIGLGAPAESAGMENKVVPGSKAEAGRTGNKTESGSPSESGGAENKDPKNPNTALKGLRREMTQEMFEELCALQCRVPEILGYVGTTEKKLGAWCRRQYRLPLADALFMLRQDGLIAIRRAGFEQLKKSATLIGQQYNRYLTFPSEDPVRQAESLARQIFSLGEPSAEEVEALFESVD